MNKLDTAGWSESRFGEISSKLGKFLRKEVGFKEADLQFVPVSGEIHSLLTRLLLKDFAHIQHVRTIFVSLKV